LPWKHLIVRAFLSWSSLAVCLSLEALALHKIGFAAVAGMTRQEPTIRLAPRLGPGAAGNRFPVAPPALDAQPGSEGQ
jgi:hypothetical protein